MQISASTRHNHACGVPRPVSNAHVRSRVAVHHMGEKNQVVPRIQDLRTNRYITKIQMGPVLAAQLPNHAEAVEYVESRRQIISVEIGATREAERPAIKPQIRIATKNFYTRYVLGRRRRRSYDK